MTLARHQRGVKVAAVGVALAAVVTSLLSLREAGVEEGDKQGWNPDPVIYWPFHHRKPLLLLVLCPISKCDDDEASQSSGKPQLSDSKTLATSPPAKHSYWGR